MRTPLKFDPKQHFNAIEIWKMAAKEFATNPEVTEVEIHVPIREHGVTEDGFTKFVRRADESGWKPDVKGTSVTVRRPA